ncbi:tRNA lysidine(34) synthetase TilS [uncultured Roseovarius sp.]|uniref:tRNA lysidine(34) synthetase TilS n=1 Tax=uncultured Roseovarius sp. TaxID=293344 RepID=UPI0026059DDA|nr:tRNA lysidine(34) synthetase TilS [uncultured Roseovarius sp.]
MTGPDAALAARVAGHFNDDPPERLGVAVSGGSDSLALLFLLQEWQRSGGPVLHAVTVDHGLRPDAAAEAMQVERICGQLGIAHVTLHWRGWDGKGNLPDHARRARYRLIADWAEANGVRDVAIGHTRDDQAETFLMRLARGAGLDGLSAMRARWTDGRVTFHRPMLGLGRATLQEYLRARGQTWTDDPTNADTAYERPRARAALAALAPLGLDADKLSTVAQTLAEARTALYHAAHAALRDLGDIEAGDLLLHHDGFNAVPDDVARRVLQAALRWLSGADYVPRGQALTNLLVAARAGQAMTLQGCLLLPAQHGRLRLTREFDAVKALRAPAHALWDGRWRADGPDITGDIEIAALGPEGLARCPDWRGSGLPHASALATPGLWKGSTLVAAPLMGWTNGWTLKLDRDRDKLLAMLLSH